MDDAVSRLVTDSPTTAAEEFELTYYIADDSNYIKEL